MAQLYYKSGSISQTSGVTGYPCRLRVGESNGLPLCFSPALWLDASDASTITTESDKVSQWADKSGNARHAAQATADNRPVVGSAVIDGKNTIQFDGSNDYLTVSSFPTDASAYSVYAVLKVDNDPPAAGAQSGLFTFDGDASLNGHYPSTDGAVYMDFATTERKTVGNPSPSLASAHLLNFDSAASSWQCRINGTQIYTTASNTVGMSSATNYIGKSPNYFDGDFAEIIIFPSVLNYQNRLLIEGYLAHKWGLESSLPTSHPYKTVAPVMAHCNGHCRSDFGDIRFYDASDNALDYWIDWGTLTGTTPNQSVEVWVKTAAATDGTTVKMKYGDAALDDASDPSIFDLHEDAEWGDDDDPITDSGGSVTWIDRTYNGVISTDTAHTGTRSIALNYDATNRISVRPTITVNEGNAIRFWLKRYTNQSYIEFFTGAGDASYGLMLVFNDNDLSVNYKASPTPTDTGLDIVSGEWNFFEIKNINYTAHTATLQVNNETVTVSMRSGVGTGGGFWFYGGNYGGSAGYFTYIDDLIVRKYVNPEPVWGTWGEETAVATELTVAASSHAASSDNVSLIQGLELTVADSASVLTSDGTSLTQVYVLTLGDSSHITDSGIVSLVADFRLAITDSSHLADSDNVGLVPDFRLVVAEPVNVVGSENLELSTSTPLVIASSTSLLSSDNIDLIQLCILVVEGSSSASTSEEPSLSHSGLLLTIGDSLHSMGADNVEVFQSHVLTVSDSTSLFTPSGELIFLEFWVHPGGVPIGPFGNLELLLLEGNLELLFFSGDLELLSFTGGLE